MTSISARRIFFLAVAVPLAASLIGGCVSSSEKTTSVPASPTVVVPADRTVAAPSTVVVTPSSGRVITYPEGRYELRGDGSGGDYCAVGPARVTPAAAGASAHQRDDGNGDRLENGADRSLRRGAL